MARNNRTPQKHDHSNPGSGGSGVNPESLKVQNTQTDPSDNGELRRNGQDVKVRSGGSVKSLTDIGTGSGSSVGSVEVVSSAPNLQTALNNNDIVRVDGVLDVSAAGVAPVTVPQYTAIHGVGGYQYTAANDTTIVNDAFGDAIVGNESAGPLLIAQQEARIMGLTLKNDAADGSCVRLNAGLIDVKNCKMASKHRCITNEGSTQKVVEPHIHGNVFSAPDPAADTAIYADSSINGAFNYEVRDNTFRGFNYGIQMLGSEAGNLAAEQNHIYNFPWTDRVAGISIQDANYGRHLISMNHVELAHTDVGISVGAKESTVVGNVIRDLGVNDADGLELVTTASDNVQTSAVGLNVITGGGTGNTAIRASSASVSLGGGSFIAFNTRNAANAGIYAGTPAYRTTSDPSTKAVGDTWYRTDLD